MNGDIKDISGYKDIKASRYGNIKITKYLNMNYGQNEAHFLLIFQTI